MGATPLAQDLLNRKLVLADAYRTNQLQQFQKAQQDIDTLLSSKQIMENGALRPLTPEEITDWTQKRQQVAQHIQNLYNPSFDPGRNMVPEDPLHKLASKIHLAKPRPVGEAKNAAQQKAELQAIAQRAISPPGTEEAQREQVRETQRKQKIDAAVKAMREAGATDEEIKQFQMRASEAAVGVKTSMTQRKYTSPDGKEADWFLPGEQPQGWTALTPKTVTKLVKDKSSPTGYSYATFNPFDGSISSIVPNAPPQRGLIVRESISTDLYGNKTVTVSGPQADMEGGGVPSGTPAPSPSTPPVKTPNQQKSDLRAIQGRGKIALDEDGHIPPSKAVNENVRQAANQLLDGQDITKLDARVRNAAASLAEKGGWKGQGKFTPRDLLLVRESATLLTQFGNSKSLEILNDATSRAKVQQVLQNPEKRSTIGQQLQQMVAANLSPEEQEFVTLYNQAVGRISGLSQLVRSGRPTEATIERLKMELPNPATTADAAHAKAKLAQIQNEIDIAMQKGNFGDTTTYTKAGEVPE